MKDDVADVNGLSLVLTIRKSPGVYVSVEIKEVPEIFFFEGDNTCTVGDRIREMRKLRGLNHFQLATKVGVTRSCEEAWEENATVPASDKIIPLSEVLNCDPLWLLTGKGSFNGH